MCPYVIVHVTTVRDSSDPDHYARTLRDCMPEDEKTYAMCTCGWTAVGRLARMRAWAHRVANS